MVRNEKGSAIVAVFTIAIILNIALLAFHYSVKNTTKKSGIRKTKTSVLNIAEAGKEHLYGQVGWGMFKPKADTMVSAFSNKPFKNGSFSVACSANTTIDTIFVRSTGREREFASTIECIAALSPDITIPIPPIRGAITARSNIIIKGNIEVDGRDYDSSNVLIGPGLFGVSTCMSLSVEGSATVGGNSVAPVSKQSIESVFTTVAQESAPINGSFDSPEAFLGLPPGSLDQYKVSTLTTPFNGLVYLTDDYVGPVQFENSSGVLIVHNKFKTSELQITNGSFKGLIICDRMAKVNGDAQILGAVVTLCDGEVSTFGNGTAVIRYSSYVLSNLNKFCNNLKKKVSEVSWKEL